MPYPSVSDDGQTIELDLHGASVQIAEDMILATIPLAANRGRSVVRVIHGVSTSETFDDRSTIKSALLALLEQGTMDRYVTDWIVLEGSTLVSLNVTGQRDSTRILIRDIT
ncbi:MAG: Smr/MutS family protein [Rhodothermales bacterium]|nr:Smr/MutS family protein [Rhodothermales bacterium]